jgi:hypothetical protein
MAFSVVPGKRAIRKATISVRYASVESLKVKLRTVVQPSLAVRGGHRNSGKVGVELAFGEAERAEWRLYLECVVLSERFDDISPECEARCPITILHQCGAVQTGA